MGAIGVVFGNYLKTLSEMDPLLNKDGLIIIDDAYIEDECNKDYPNVLRKSELLLQMNNAGMELIEKITIDDIPEVNENFDNDFENIKKRCTELIEKYPEDKEIFLEYIETQKREYEILENEIIPAIFIIKKME